MGVGKDETGTALLSTVTLTVAKSDSSIELDSGALLRLIPCPTPRWPDLLALSSDADRILFSSKVGWAGFYSTLKLVTWATNPGHALVGISN